MQSVLPCSGSRLTSRLLSAMLALPSTMIGVPRLLEAQTDRDPDAIIGAWVTENGDGVVEITRCPGMSGQVYCGVLAPFYEGDSLPDYCGHRLIYNFIPDGQGEWRDGIIIDPRNGNEWDAIAWLEDGVLRVRGYLGISLFGQTQSWQPWDGLGQVCR